mgnify:CR=1 FL=1
MTEVEQGSTPKKLVSSCWALTFAGFIMLVMAAVAGPKLIASRVGGNEAAAIGGLKMIHNAQLLHHEKGGAKCASLAELGAVDLIDGVLASGTKQGYAFQCLVSTAHPTSAWAVTAAPLVPGETGDRYFAINQEGVVYTSDKAPIVVDPATCAMPAGAQPLGR